MPYPDTPATRDGYLARSGRDYKSKALYDSWWGEANPYADYGVLYIEGDSDEHLLVWEFIIEHFRHDSESIPGDVHMIWLDPDDSIWGNNPQHIHAVGYTDGDPGNVVIRLNRAIKPGGSQYNGREFIWDVMAHEWGHAYLINAPSSAVEMIPPLFDKTMTDWDNADWSLSVKEAWCETYKDIALTRAKRKFDNRTQLKIARAKWFGAINDTNFPFDLLPPAGFSPQPPGTYQFGEVWNTLWALGDPSGPFGWKRYFTAGAHQALLYGIGNLPFNRAMPFPSIYPYPTAPAVPSTIGAGAATSGAVLI